MHKLQIPKFISSRTFHKVDTPLGLAPRLRNRTLSVSSEAPLTVFQL